jgi:hypothetical protein
MATISVTGLERALAKFKTVENIAIAIAPELDGLESYLLKEVRNQPRKKPGAFSAMATDKQRKAYWAKVRSGEAQHGAGGYVRSYNLWRSWKRVPKTVTATRIIIGVGNDAPHVQYVHGKQRQPFHRASGWKTDNQLANDQRKVVGTKVKRAIDRAISK